VLPTGVRIPKNSPSVGSLVSASFRWIPSSLDAFFSSSDTFFSSLDRRKEAKEDQGTRGACQLWPGTDY